MELRRPLVPLLLSCLVFLPAQLGAGEPVFEGTSSGNTQLMDSSMAARQFQPFDLLWLAQLSDLPGGEQSIRCTVHAQDGRRPRKGVKVDLTAELLDANGDVIGASDTLRKRTDRNGDLEVDFDLDALNLADGLYIPAVGIQYRGAKRATSIETECTARTRIPCTPDATTLCLNDERFQVEVDWNTGSQSGQGMVFSTARDEGSFFFFDPNNVELLLKVLDGCRDNGHYWVFYGALTNVEYEIRVTDTETGAAKRYFNPLGNPAPAITDTAAFATCP